MHPEDRDWIAYIDAEVRAVCKAKGWEVENGPGAREPRCG
jgi:hypothetical protein